MWLPKAKFGYKSQWCFFFLKKADLCWISMHHSYASSDICNSNIVLCKWEGIREAAGKASAFLLTESRSLFQSHPETVWGHTRASWEREYCGKSDIFSPHLLQSLQKMFTVRFFPRGNVSADCPGWVMVVRPQCLQLTETPQKDEYRSVVLCIVGAFIVIIWAQLRFMYLVDY